jgi:tRNA A37 N6-isopentenylltransferase MiaA
LEILAKWEEKGKLPLLVRGTTYYIVVLDREEDILFLAKGDQLARAFKEQEQRQEKGVNVS